MPLRKKGVDPRAAETPSFTGDTPQGLIHPETPSALLGTPRRRLLIQHIWQRTSLSRGQFQRLYQEPIERFASLVQNFPASEAHHHAYAGGMLDHGLEIVAFGLKLRQSYLLPVGAAPEVQAAQAEAWTAAVAYAALLHDIGKLAVDLEVEYADGSPWHPWHESLTQEYRFRFRSDRTHRLHEAATGLLYTRILGPTILDWLSGYSDLWAALLYVLASRHEHAGVLGELVAQADRASVAQSLGGDATKTQPDSVFSLQRKLREGLRYLVRERYRLNQLQASDGWLTQDALWLVSKTACDKLRAHLLSNGISGVPESNSVLFDVLQEHGLVLPTAGGRAIWTARVNGTNGWTQEFTFLKLAPSLIWDDVNDRPSTFQGHVTPAAASKGIETSATLETPKQSSSSAEVENCGDSPTDATGVYPGANVDRPGATNSMPLSNSRSSEPAQGSPIFTPELQNSDAGSTPGYNADPPHAHETASSEAGPASPNSPGAHFLDWLKLSIGTRKLIVNDARALVHTVDGTAFIVTPRIFQRYLQEFPVIRSDAEFPRFRPTQFPRLRTS